MQDHVRQFLEATESAGIAPSNPAEIIADDKRRRYHVAGDNRRKLNGIYQLRSDGDFAVGWFKSFRIGETHSWHSKTTRKFTAEEKAAWKARVEASKAAADDERERLANAAAARAMRLWARAKPTQAPLPPYLVGKGYESAPASRRIGCMLLTPGWNSENQLRTLQCTTADGDKRFLKDSEKAGCFCVIAEPGDDRSRIIVCEGYATGLAIREAMGCPVVVAYDAGNLYAVAQIMRGRYPDSEIIFAADNDRWTRESRFKPSGVDPDSLPADDPVWDAWRQAGHLRNVGVLAAQQAAVKIGGARVVIPSFADVTLRPTDFDDLRRQEGPDAVRAAFAAPAPVADDDIPLPPPPDDYPVFEDVGDYYAQQAEMIAADMDGARKKVALYAQSGMKPAPNKNWAAMLKTNQNGNPVREEINMEVLLEHHPDVCDVFCYDEFYQTPMLCACPPWESEDRFKPRVMSDEDVTRLQTWAQRQGVNVVLSKGAVNSCLVSAIKKNPRNPVRYYFASLQWDGVKRLDSWLADYCGALNDPIEYTSFVGRKWLCGAVARVMKPGVKFDHMLILEGKQGTRKSTLLKELATFGNELCFTDDVSLGKLENKETVSKIQGVLIVEFSELAGISKASVEELKSFISREIDRPVQKYSNYTSQFPRQCVFAGTINPEDGYLPDSTGNRRFWPVATGKIDIDGVRAVKEQLWAEAVHYVKNGEEIYVQASMQQLLRDVVDRRRQESPWHNAVSDIVRSMRSVTTDEVFERMGVTDMTKRTQSGKREIGKILTVLGWEYKARRVNGSVKKMWILDDEEIAF